ncbi:MAG: histidine phosphatase family protein [Chitinophagaceae bacterium]|nr:histidine phosphatase family protein [Chitinophagaceae bacterium]
MRHAKSSWNDASVTDFDRPLNDRGKKDAPVIAKRLRKKGFEIDGFISSPAKRALTTAEIFAEEFGVKKKKIITMDELYQASPASFFKLISELDNELKRVIVFSHNPGITDFVNQLTDSRVDDMPTCAVFAAEADCKKWKDFASAERTMIYFDYPKLVD